MYRGFSLFLCIVFFWNSLFAGGDSKTPAYTLDSEFKGLVLKYVQRADHNENTLDLEKAILGRLDELSYHLTDAGRQLAFFASYLESLTNFAKRRGHSERSFQAVLMLGPKIARHVGESAPTVDESGFEMNWPLAAAIFVGAFLGALGTRYVMNRRFNRYIERTNSYHQSLRESIEKMAGVGPNFHGISEEFKNFGFLEMLFVSYAASAVKRLTVEDLKALRASSKLTGMFSKIKWQAERLKSQRVNGPFASTIQKLGQLNRDKFRVDNEFGVGQLTMMPSGDIRLLREEVERMWPDRKDLIKDLKILESIAGSVRQAIIHFDVMASPIALIFLATKGTFDGEASASSSEETKWRSALELTEAQIRRAKDDFVSENGFFAKNLAITAFD